MTESPTPLFATNVQAFMDVVAIDDTEVRVNSLHTLDDMAVCEMLRYGISGDGSQVPNLMKFYRELFMMAPVERRWQIYKDLVEMVRWLGGNTVGALQPFMFMDTDIQIVSTATIDYASIGSLFTNNDPMSRPIDTINMVAHGIATVPAAVIGGLLALGDPRVCKLIEPLRRGWDHEQARIVSICHSGLTAKCVVEFYLDWLDELIEREDWDSQAKLGNVLAGLCRQAGQRQLPVIVDGLRPFPYDDEDQTWMKSIEPDAFAASIADRLYDLEEREAAPKGMPHAIAAFGLVPKTPRSDWTEVDLPWGPPPTRN